jgi:hypothetical protein
LQHCSELGALLLALSDLIVSLILIEDSTHNLEGGLLGGLVHAHDFQLAIARAVLPVAVRVFVEPRDLQVLLRVLVDQVELVAAQERLFVFVIQAVDYPVVV